jgi:hypothetical protein
VADLRALYDDVNDIDFIIGMFSEDHLPGASTGPLLKTLMVEQITSWRDGYVIIFLSHIPCGLHDLCCSNSLVIVFGTRTITLLKVNYTRSQLSLPSRYPRTHL